MSLSRFYLPPAAWHPDQLCLAGDEAQHCSRVLRKAPGDRIEIFEGAGRVAICTIRRVTKHSVEASVETLAVSAPLSPAIHLLPAMIKAEAFEWMLEKSVELGAASVQPVITERSVVRMDADLAAKKLAKWQRLMIESAKQCHTPFVPRLEAPRPLQQVLATAPAAELRILPALSERSRTLKQLLPQSPPQDVAALIGPEGDFTPEEELLAQNHGFQPITLGPLILRAETATISLLAILSHELRMQAE